MAKLHSLPAIHLIVHFELILRNVFCSNSIIWLRSIDRKCFSGYVMKQCCLPRMRRLHRRHYVLFSIYLCNILWAQYQGISHGCHCSGYISIWRMVKWQFCIDPTKLRIGFSLVVHGRYARMGIYGCLTHGSAQKLSSYISLTKCHDTSPYTELQGILI